MFTPEEREQLRTGLVAAAKEDPRITAAAYVGSVAAGREDRWSDIDLAMCLAPGADVDEVVAEWSERMRREHDVADHLDIRAGNTWFRVFLLANTLQIDLSFWAPEDFGATGPNFQLLFGTAADVRKIGPPKALTLIGMAWLYALHARSSIARGRVWQAEYMISGVRDNVLALACLRHEVPAVQGRGMDDLPAEVTGPLLPALVRSLDRPELVRAFGATVEALLGEIALVDAELATRVTDVLRELVTSSDPAVSPA